MTRCATTKPARAAYLLLSTKLKSLNLKATPVNRLKLDPLPQNPTYPRRLRIFV